MHQILQPTVSNNPIHIANSPQNGWLAGGAAVASPDGWVAGDKPPTQGWLGGGAAVVSPDGWVAGDKPPTQGWLGGGAAVASPASQVAGDKPRTQGWLGGGAAIASPASQVAGDSNCFPSEVGIASTHDPAPHKDPKEAWRNLAHKDELGLLGLMGDDTSKKRVKSLLKRLRALKDTLQARKAQEEKEDTTAAKTEAAVVAAAALHPIKTAVHGLQEGGAGYESDFFNQRAWETESQMILDSASVLEQRWTNDWNGINKKDAFRATIESAVKMFDECTRKDKNETSCPPSADHLAAVRQVISKHQEKLRRLFCHYSAELLPEGPLENSSVQRMSCEMWIQFCDLLGLSGENGATSLNHEELKGIFAATNDAAAVLAAKAKAHPGTKIPAGSRPVDMDDATLSRGEFYEALLRAGFLMFQKQLGVSGDGVSGLPIEASDAIDSFLMGLLDKAPEAAVEDPNDFRACCLYSQEMEKTIKDHWEVLLASYNVFRSTQPKGGGVLFELETWESMLRNLDLLPGRVDRVTAAQIFQRSQMALADEINNRTRLSEISKWEFTEALARLADHVEGEGESAGGAELATRFNLLMEHIVDCMARNFGFYLGGDDDDDGNDDGDFDLDEEDKPAPRALHQIPQAVIMPDCLEDEPRPNPAAGKGPAEQEEMAAADEKREDQEDKEFDELFGDKVEGEMEPIEFQEGDAEIEFDENNKF